MSVRQISAKLLSQAEIVLDKMPMGAMLIRSEGLMALIMYLTIMQTAFPIQPQYAMQMGNAMLPIELRD